MSKRSRGQREIERLNRERLAQAQEDPNKIDWPSACAEENGCHRPAAVAVIVKAGHGKYAGWSACTRHFDLIIDVIAKLGENAKLMHQGLKAVGSSGLVVPLATPAEPNVVPVGTDTSTSSQPSES